MPDSRPATLTNPALAVGLNGLNDWSTAQPFLDHFKMARPWSGRRGEDFGVVPFAELQARGAVDARGWLLAVPGDVDAVSTVLLTEIDPRAEDLARRYRMTWAGQGRIQLLGAEIVEQGPNRILFDFAPDFGRFAEIRVTEVTDGPIRDIRVVQLDNLARHKAGHVFRLEWLDAIRNYRLLRFMDWMGTNGSAQAVWSDRPRVEDAFYGWRGAPVELMVDLANEIGADAWFNVPHLADEDWIARFAAYVRDHLRPGLQAWFEYSNEMWNMQFPQTQWAIEQARALWPGQGDGFMQFYAGRAVAMARALDRVFASRPGDLVKVLSSQTHWLGLEGAVLDASDWRAANPLLPAPPAFFDAWAVSGYFDGGLDLPENVARVRALAAELDPLRLRGRLRDQVLQGGWPESGRTIANLRQTWDYHAQVARRHGLRLVMYEGGTHIVPPAEVQTDPALSALWERFNYSAEMGQIYASALDEWRAAGGEGFNLFVECASVGNYGYWGLQRHLGDENPRWAAVDAWASRHEGMDARAEGVFVGPADLRDGKEAGP
ncbi:MAG: hypothetical protein QM682_00560 [Paracoccus sp. (in: a-proteobacteria)]|uniref:hypothetical protein n=1 Tax=Paracoccus sp. TaxID=267 RepID=UPI0039E66785